MRIKRAGYHSLVSEILSRDDIFLLDEGDKKKIDEVLKTLISREEEVLRLRFGIGSEKNLTLEETGRKIGVGRERARQIEAKALRKLKHPSRICVFKNFSKSALQEKAQSQELHIKDLEAKIIKKNIAINILKGILQKHDSSITFINSLLYGLRLGMKIPDDLE